jgi:uncharacterized protein (TIGR00725 family)
MKIAIFSSASTQIIDENLLLAQNIGKYLAEKGITVITGGSTGLPSVVVQTAFSAGAETIAYYPDLSENDLLQNERVHNNDLSHVYTHKRFFKGFVYRSVRMIEDADGAIVFNGRFGTLSEFSIAVEEGLKIAVIENTGGITGEIKRLAEIVDRQFPNSHVIFSDDYKYAVDKLIENIKKQ